MPGVADAIRRTNLKQEHKARQGDMDELLRMVRENRLHEADERQLGNLKLALEINKLLSPEPVEAPSLDSKVLAETIAAAVRAGMSGVVVRGGSLPAEDSARPGMKHVSLADLVQDDTKIDISHKDKIKKTVEGGDSSDKLKKLRKIKGSK